MTRSLPASTVLVSIILGCLSFCSCSDLADARQARGQGLVYTYQAPVHEARAAVRSYLAAEGASIIVDSPAEGLILAEAPWSAFSFGDNIAVFFDPTDPANCRIEVVSLGRMTTNVAAARWQDRVHDQLASQFTRLPPGP
ncbi:MAG: hypothetical protein KDK39_18180 [Leptospiraceae bacterium]|nr:hypothetical protein [Leptospiraceae bacterium]